MWNVQQQNEIFAALKLLDAHDSLDVNNKAVRIPYKIGSERRAITKNVNVISASLQSFNETQAALWKEIFPDVPIGTPVTPAENPEGVKRFTDEMKTLSEAKDDLTLMTLTGKMLFDSGNDFPIEATATLEKYGLIV